MGEWLPVYRERYPPIADHGLVGDGRGCALVGRDGGVGFMCVSRFNSPPLFCPLLDRDRGGCFLVAPLNLRLSQRRTDEALELFGRLRSYAGPLGLFAEQINPADRSFLGNFPQGLGHVALIASAVELARVQHGATLSCLRTLGRRRRGHNFKRY
ncbi:trehalase-like domain-containing protein [Microbispora rosea]|uniref:trehalase-like domain-containing protein n=1 Tax=Microbispora rosea TaxID=58117 RepID=UPI003427C094